MINNKKDQIISPLLTRFADSDNLKPINSDQYITIEQLYDEIRNNLETILNTKHLCLDWDSYQKELNSSIVNYGIRDFGHLPINNKTIQQEFCLEMQAIVEHFEPRLKQVQIKLVTDDVNTDRKLKIRINALIQITKSKIPATFESYLDNNKYTFEFI